MSCLRISFCLNCCSRLGKRSTNDCGTFQLARWIIFATLACILEWIEGGISNLSTNAFPNQLSFQRWIVAPLPTSHLDSLQTTRIKWFKATEIEDLWYLTLLVEFVRNLFLRKLDHWLSIDNVFQGRDNIIALLIFLMDLKPRSLSFTGSETFSKPL